LLYGFAALLLAVFSAHSVLAEWVNTVAALSALVFFAFAIGTYVIHGLLQDTDNQLRRPHRVGKTLLPPWLTGLFMNLLIIGEVAGAFVLGTGAMLGIWNS
jgi:Kef-type K+ transport system membrane component KefB